MRARVAMLIGALLWLPLVSANEDNDESNENYETGWAGTKCSPPEMALDGNSVASSSTDYSKVMEVMFQGAIGPLGERRLCKIKCINGEWVGPLCQVKSGGGKYHPLFRSCHFGALPPQLLVMYKNVSIVADTRLPFPDGAQVSVRCRELGVYKLLGESSLTCQNGVWSHEVPNCIPTTLLTNFTDDAPPTVLVRVPAGSASVEPDGELAVFPGSIVHLECVFARKLGNPEWSWSSSFRQYLTGWAISAEERDWKYRLSIYYSKPQDSGAFTCTTPHGLTNSVTINVVAIHCAPLEVDDPHVTARVEGSRLGHTAVFQCPTGFVLNGTANLTCHATGKWSGPPPSCTPVRCPRLRDIGDPHLELIEQNTSYLGRAYYRCRWGYRLTGPPGLECGSDGRWIGDIPRCQPVHCPPPLPPANGRILEAGGRALSDGRYAVGSAVQFGCSDSHQLMGEPTIVCTENGFWSHKAPLCKPRCPYPGDPENGRIAPLKFYYEPGDHVKVTCNPGFVIRERTATSRPTCRPDGSWSEQIPSCVDYTQV
ncbi:locomotion-related protein Hikaru genki-like [Neocloeon triangulifer]|uniref:locomotion-related protein Hikaru genki-like n=1 Tax=Neocloeon triangulifer TaxID=2078957 RepID=UPI00286F4363|nr:locomotion-related protein Hikaru genki-like [Neocloeon triangulifer]